MQLRRIVLSLTCTPALLTASAVLAEDPAPGGGSSALRWDREGYAALMDASSDAKATDRRLLLGLSGSPT